MHTATRLLIMSCSRTKRPNSELLPAMARYDGPAFRVLHRFLKLKPDAGVRFDVFVLSAAHGLISGRHLIEEYDHVMTRTRARELHNRVMTDFGALAALGYSEICLSMSQTYLQALEGWQAYVPSGTAVTITGGPQGVKLAQLKAWLWGDPTKDTSKARKTTVARGEAHLKGVTLRLTPNEVLEHARVALANNAAGADTFREWYVDIDDVAVSVKWLVNRLTRVPVSVFTSGEARRVLGRLGIQVCRCAGGDSRR